MYYHIDQLYSTKIRNENEIFGPFLNHLLRNEEMGVRMKHKFDDQHTYKIKLKTALNYSYWTFWRYL
jgi:hypothetical protein